MKQGSTQDEAIFVLTELFRDHRSLYWEMIQSDDNTNMYILSLKSGGAVYGKEGN